MPKWKMRFFFWLEINMKLLLVCGIDYYASMENSIEQKIKYSAFTSSLYPINFRWFILKNEFNSIILDLGGTFFNVTYYSKTQKNWAELSWAKNIDPFWIVHGNTHWNLYDSVDASTWFQWTINTWYYFCGGYKKMVKWK